MKLLGKLEQLVELVFRKGSYTFKVKPNESTVFTADRTYQLPPGNADQEIVGTTGIQTLTGKSISGANNTLSSIPNSATTATSSNTVDAIVSRDASGNFSAGTITASFSGNLTGNVTGNVSGTAANITATTNNTLTTLSSLSLPGSQITGNIVGTASNITATSNNTLTTLSSLSLPGSQITGNIPGNSSNVTGIIATANGGTGINSTTVFPSSGIVVTRDANETLLNKQISSTGLITGALTVPVGLQSERPSTPVNGMIRYNTTFNTFEGYVNNDWGGLASVGNLPPGTMIDYAGTVEPSGWLLCDGRSVPTTGIYSSLFAVIGYAYGGSGANFNIPDFRGRFARYMDNMGTVAGAAGRDSGRVLGAAQTDAIQSHRHSISDPGHSHSDSGHTHSELQAASGTAGAYVTFNIGGPGSLSLRNATGTTGNGFANLSSSVTNISVLAPTVDGANGTPRTAAETRPINLSCNRLIKL